MMHQKSVNSDNTDNFDEVWNNFERVLVEQIVRPIAPNYDFIIMDCAPGYNLLTKSAIASSDFYLLPARPEPLSLVGIQLLERRVRNLKKVHAKINPLNLDLLGIVFILSEGGLFGRYDRYYSQVKRRVERDFSSEKMFPTDIPMDVNVAKSLDMFMPVVMSAPNCLASKAFNKLTEEFLQKIAHCKTNNG